MFLSSGGGGGRSSGFEISFALSKEITTSDDPFQAGRASDIIVGGGVELQFTEIFVVDQRKVWDCMYPFYYADPVKKTPAKIEIHGGKCEQDLCMEAKKSTQWEPAKLTTFVYPVYKIVVSRL
jgi:hypothetical protein